MPSTCIATYLEAGYEIDDTIHYNDLSTSILPVFIQPPMLCDLLPVIPKCTTAPVDQSISIHELKQSRLEPT